MGDIGIYSVSDRYITYLRSDERLKNVLENEEETRTHTRKYLGVVLKNDNFNYFIPFSSPKRKDYIEAPDGTKQVRQSIIPIIRMTSQDSITGEVELKGTLKLNNMIPVPDSELMSYDVSQETDIGYRQVVNKEWEFIRRHLNIIRKNARVLYNQKTKSDILFAEKKKPGYLDNTVDFQYAESKCREFQAQLVS